MKKKGCERKVCACHLSALAIILKYCYNILVIVLVSTAVEGSAVERHDDVDAAAAVVDGPRVGGEHCLVVPHLR